MRSCGEWKIERYDSESFNRLVNAGYMPLVSALLCSRGIRDAREAAEFLRDDLGQLSDPFLMKDMDKAAKRIKQAIKNKEHVAVYGDYDVDGITSTCLVSNYLRSKGLQCRVYIPERLTEGYGINSEALLGLKEQGINLIITVDCGVTATEQAELAKKLGIDMLITDHHECPDELPDAVAVVNPRRKDCPYPFKGLAGVGVAFKLLCALEGGGTPDTIMENYGDLAAIGTIADIMPLVSENRAIVRRGIEVLTHGKRIGLSMLMKETGISQMKITSADISFSLVPKLNAAGRMGKVEMAYDLLMSEDEKSAGILASDLCELNQERRTVENRIFNEAVEIIKSGNDVDSIIVLASENWHHGVSGIVASRLADRFGVPAIIICLEGNEGRGSCRSFGGFCIFNAIEASKQYLTSFGGHAFAAGLTIKKDDIEAFTNCVRENVRKSKAASGSPEMHIDFEVSDTSMLSLKDVEALGRISPWGNSNPPPLLCILGAQIDAIIPIGGEKHLKIRVSKNGTVFECVFFSLTSKELGLRTGTIADLAFEPVINDFRGTRSVQLVLRDLQSSRQREMKEKELCMSFLAGKELSSAEKRCLLPVRNDFAAVWRYIITLPRPSVGESDALICEINHKSGLNNSGKTYICLKVFNELGLIDLFEGEGSLRILIKKNAAKVDLNSSEIIAALRQS